MKRDKRIEYVTRDSVMKLLSDDEIARISTAESAGRLSPGDEYLDLEHLGLGVLRTDGQAISIENTLSKKTVKKDTWTAILAMLASHPAS